MMQFCFPKDNEEEFIKIALKLNLKEICFVYADAGKIRNVNAKEIKLHKALLYKGKQLDKKKYNVDLIIADHSESDRALIESRKVDLIYNLESNKEQDFIHYRNSGLNQVIAELCAKKKVRLIFNLNLVVKSKGKKRSIVLGRMMQNMMLCSKFKVDYSVGNFASSAFELRSSKALEAFESLLR